MPTPDGKTALTLAMIVKPQGFAANMMLGVALKTMPGIEQQLVEGSRPPWMISPESWRSPTASGTPQPGRHRVSPAEKEPDTAMPNAQRTIVIHRPPDQVFAFFANPANDQSWRPHVKEIAAEGAARVGSRIHQVVEGPGGRGIAADIEVTAYEPPTRYAFQVVAGPARPRGEFRFIETATGTEVTSRSRPSSAGSRSCCFPAPVQRSMDGEIAALDTAKRLIEAAE